MTHEEYDSNFIESGVLKAAAKKSNAKKPMVKNKLEQQMKTGIILGKYNQQLTDDCGNPIKLIITTDKSLCIEFNTHNGSHIRKEQMTLGKDVVELLAQRLNEVM